MRGVEPRPRWESESLLIGALADACQRIEGCFQRLDTILEAVDARLEFDDRLRVGDIIEFRTEGVDAVVGNRNVDAGVN